MFRPLVASFRHVLPPVVLQNAAPQTVRREPMQVRGMAGASKTATFAHFHAAVGGLLEFVLLDLELIFRKNLH